MIQLTDAAVIVNNEVVGIIPNSLSFDPGLGEQNVRSVSVGGGKTEQLYSQDVESNIGVVKFSVPTTVDNVKLVRAWKVNQNRNVVQIAGSTPDGKSITQTFTAAALTKRYEVPIGTEGAIELEFMANAAI